MKFKEILIQANTNIKKRKKNTILTLLLLIILFLIIIICLTSNNIISSFIRDFYYNSYSGREYMINTDYNKIDIDELEKKLQNIDGIVKTYKTSERITTTTVSIKDSKIGTGSITLFGSDNDVLPRIILGNTFSYSSDDEIELICPIEMAIGYTDLLSTNYVDMSNYLNYNLKLSVNEYDLTNNSKKITKTQDFNVKIVGLYDAQANKFSNNYCFANFNFIKKINEINKFNSYNALVIVIDDYKNYEEISKKITMLFNDKFESEFSLGTMWELDNASIEVVKSTINLILYITISISVFIEFLIIIKNIKKRKSEIGIYKAIGYDNNSINLLFCYENSILLLISFIVSSIIMTIILLIIKYLASTKYYALLNFSFSLPIIKYFLIFIIIFFIINMITFLSFKSINNKNSTELLGN